MDAELKKYIRGEDVCETELVQEAIYRIYRPDIITLFISEPKNAHIASTLESRNVPVQKVWIPTGAGEDDLWKIFSLLCQNVEQGEEIIFDVTNGCHVFPFVTFGAAAYLRSVKNVRVKGIIYGAGMSGDGNEVHIVELTPLLHLLDWINGVHAFSEYVDAEPLRSLLSGLQSNIHRMGTESSPPTHLIGWSHLLGSFTSAVRLSRPVQAQYAAEGITRDLTEIQDEIIRFAPSIGPVIRDIESLKVLGASPPSDGITRDYLFKQLLLIRYQLKENLLLQAVTLAREWLISITMLRFDLGTEWLDPDLRHQISRTLTGGILALQKLPYEETKYSEQLYQIDTWRDMARIWARISDIRNDLAHCGMNVRDESIHSIERRGNLIIADLEEYFRLTE